MWRVQLTNSKDAPKKKLFSKLMALTMASKSKEEGCHEYLDDWEGETTGEGAIDELKKLARVASDPVEKELYHDIFKKVKACLEDTQWTEEMVRSLRQNLRPARDEF